MLVIDVPIQCKNMTNYSPPLVDSHCHLDRLDLAPFDGSLDRALNLAWDQGLTHLLCVSAELENFPEILRIAQTYPKVSATVGLHPTEQVVHEPSIEEIVALATHPKVLGIGETGLDYYRSEGDLTWQRQRFRNHIRAAKQLGKPLVVHTREAREDTLQILREENAKEVGGVLHCFTEDLAMAERAIEELGFYISFSGIVTFHNAKALKEVAQRVPLENMLIETDAPYLAPVPFRGKSNHPAYVRYVAECIAALQSVPVARVAEQTTQNFFKLFRVY